MRNADDAFDTLGRLLCAGRSVRLLLEDDHRAGPDLELGHWLALATLQRAPAPMRMTDLAVSAGCSRSEMTRLVRGLAARNLVSHSAADNDRRARRISITAAGQRTLQSVRNGLENRFRVILRGLPAAVRRELDRALGLLCTRMSDHVRRRLSARSRPAR